MVPLFRFTAHICGNQKIILHNCLAKKRSCQFTYPAIPSDISLSRFHLIFHSNSLYINKKQFNRNVLHWSRRGRVNSCYFRLNTDTITWITCRYLILCLWWKNFLTTCQWKKKCCYEYWRYGIFKKINRKMSTKSFWCKTSN